MPETDRPGTERLFDLAYPEQLREKERKLLDRAPKIGVAISGGGIRSATFALGVFQGIAATKLLGKIDAISTVSGGGYFGGFLGRLFHHPYVTGVADVESILTGPHPSNPDPPPTLAQAQWKILGWLRENGRYLSPRGAGDLLLGGAVLLRNWVSIHVVLGTFVLAVFLALQSPRALGHWILQHPGFEWLRRLDAGQAAALATLPFKTWMWWSPWMFPGLLVLAFAIPAGWAYWLVPRSQKRRSSGRWLSASDVWGWTAIGVAIAAGIAGWRDRPWHEHVPPDHGRVVAAWTGIAIGGIAALTAAGWALAMWLSRSVAVSYSHLSGAQMRLFRDADTRHRLSNVTMLLLLAGAALLTLGVIDSVGQTIYWQLHADTFKKWAAGIGAGFAGLAGIARQLVVMAGAQPHGQRPRVPVSIAALAIAIVLVGTTLVGLDILSHAIAWQFGRVPTPIAYAPPSESVVTLTIPADQVVQFSSQPGVKPAPPVGGSRTRARVLLIWILGTTLLAFAFGRAFAFLNQSSHQMLYAARLTRAYLGASNPARWHSKVRDIVPVIEPLPGDDIEIHEYWQPPGPGAPSARRNQPARGCHDPDDVYKKGMPLHFVNVTVNETYDGQSQVQQQDRKGVGMALGPAGMSVGVRHHVVLRSDDTASRGDGRRHVSIQKVYPDGKNAFKVFDYPERDHQAPEDVLGPEFPWDPLSFGRWIGISGAAFSTGVGSRTSLGLSLLTGLANVRLGYWWDSGVDPARRKQKVRERISTSALRWFTAAFPVQAFLFSEFLARFPGTAHRRWYLSDGGHFENMGGYELIRRRLSLIFVIDAEADPDYNFEGLSNLVRKARLDFQTEIHFLSEIELKEKNLGAEATGPDAESLAWRRLWGPLDKLRPVAREADTVGPQIAASPARFALARVSYPSDVPDRKTGWLVYMKPTLQATDPADVLEYARSHHPFPQQTTADQFFDEAQWESYRRLGEHIASLLLEASRSPVSDINRWLTL